MRRTLLIDHPPPGNVLDIPGLDALAFNLSREWPASPGDVAKRIRITTQQHQLPIAALICCAATETPGVDAVTNQVSNLIRLAAGLEADQVHVCPSVWCPREQVGLGCSERLQRLATGLREVQALAEDWAVDVVLDLVYTGFLTEPPEAAGFIDELAAAPFGLALDCAAAPMATDPADWLLTLAHRVRSVRGLSGHPNAETLVALLSTLNYEGLLLVEAANEAHPQPQDDVVKEAS